MQLPENEFQKWESLPGSFHRRLLRRRRRRRPDRSNRHRSHPFQYYPEKKSQIEVTIFRFVAHLILDFYLRRLSRFRLGLHTIFLRRRGNNDVVLFSLSTRCLDLLPKIERLRERLRKSSDLRPLLDDVLVLLVFALGVFPPSVHDGGVDVGRTVCIRLV